MRVFFSFVLLAFAALLVGPSTLAQETWPPKIENLEFYPPETSFRELMSSMRQFSFALGVRCQYCHVGEEGQPLSAFDFASDAKEAKVQARLMLKMTRAINADHLSGLTRHEQRMKVECVTCHRGLIRPEQLDRLLVRAALEGGAAAALVRYDSLRSEHFGSQGYDFSERTLIVAGEALADLENLEAALAFHERNLELFPESKWSLGTLARTRSLNGDRQGAISVLEQLLKLDPENLRARQQLERLMASEETQ